MMNSKKPYSIIILSHKVIFIVITFLLFSCSGSPKHFKKSNEKKLIEYENRLEALQNFDFDYRKGQIQDNFEDGLYQSLELIGLLEFSKAEEKLRKLLITLQDSSKRFIVKKILVDLLFFKNDWESIINLDSMQKADLKDENPLVLVEAFSELEPEKVTFNSDSTIIKYEKSHSGTPILEVFVNGKKSLFWFDTGANYTVIASDIAREGNIKPIKFKSSKAMTATSLQINVLPSVLNEFKIGNMEILNHPVIIADESDLRFKLFGSNRITKVDGIIGWKAIQKMDVTFNDKTLQATIKKPKIDHSIARNLFWLGIPFLKIYSNDDIPLIFGLDTGSEKSTITSNIFKKLNYDDIYSLTKKIGSAGGWTFSESKNISHLSVRIDNKSIEYTDIGTTFPHQKLFIKLDGIIGSEIFQNNKVRIDILNGRFSIDNK